MSNNQDIFERLVVSLDSGERKDLLQKLAEIGETQQNADLSKNPYNAVLEGKQKKPQESYLKEPFIIRIWFKIKSFFVSIPAQELYAAALVSNLGRTLSKDWSMYIDVSSRQYTATFADRITELRTIQKFLSTLLTEYQNDKGKFYVLLGTLLIEESSALISAAVNPFDATIVGSSTHNVRSSFLRKIEDAFSSIPELDRSKMLSASKSVEWMKSFCELPLDRIIDNFDSSLSIHRTCPIGLIANELKKVAQVLASAKRINFFVLETLFLFSKHNEIDQEKLNLEKECSVFINQASIYLTGIRNFKNTVPLADFIRFSIGDISWEIQPSSGGEDWFGYFKLAWKAQFEEHWNKWNSLQQSQSLELRIIDLFKGKSAPPLVSIPWKEMWVPLPFRRELSISFLKGFFQFLYPSLIMRPLKIILIEGEFYKRDDLIEYTDAFNSLEYGLENIESFEARLSEKGDIGVGFNLLYREKMVTVQAKTRLENLMLTANADAEQIISKVTQSFKILINLLGKITGQKKESLVGVLANYSAIQGRLNEQFRKELIVARQKIIDSQAILDEADHIELKIQ